MGIIYILTNKWYREDNIYKVGRHSGDRIYDLLRQYATRYIPRKELVIYWMVDDDVITEKLIHLVLKETKGIRCVESEWFQGDIARIISLIEYHLDLYQRDEYRIEVNDRIYPLSYLSDIMLDTLGTTLGISCVRRYGSPEWHTMMITLIYYQSLIIECYQDDRLLPEEVAIRLGEPNDHRLLSKLYVQVYQVPDHEMSTLMNDLSMDLESQEQIIKEISDEAIWQDILDPDIDMDSKRHILDGLTRIQLISIVESTERGYISKDRLIDIILDPQL